MIQMIAGVYGLAVKQPNGKTRVVAKGPEDGPFSVTPEREAELVGKGLARYVQENPPHVEDEQPVYEENEAPVEEDGAPVGFDEMPVEGIAIPEYSESMKAAELREIGAEFGLSFKVGMTKAEMVAALDAYFEEMAEAEGDETEDDGEPAPDFDASEAVL